MSRFLFLIPLCFLVGACSSIQVTHSPNGKVTLYDSKPVKTEVGIASWYKDRRTASGERFDAHAMAAAHKKLPFGSKVRVTDLKTDKSVIVRINDRGPYKKGRIIDLTYGAAEELGICQRGLAKVRVDVLREIPLMTKPNLHSKPIKVEEFAESVSSSREVVR